MIKLETIAYLGKDAIINEVNGRKVANFSIAHTEHFRDKQGNMKESTQWLSCQYWDDNMKIGGFLRKGQQVYVSGKPYTKLWTPQNGEPQAQLCLNVIQIQLCGNSPSTENTSERRLATEGNHYSQHPYVNPNRQNTAQGTISADSEPF